MRVLKLFLLFCTMVNIGLNAQNIGVKTVSPQTVLDVNGSVAMREGTALVVINGTNNNVVIDTMSFYRITAPTAVFSITGFTNGSDGRLLTIINASSYTMTLKHQSVSSTAANRINTGGSDMAVPTNGVVSFVYNATLTNWVVSSTQGVIPSFLTIATGLVTDSMVTINNGVLGKSDPQTYISSYAWSLLGNNGTTAGTNFIGTTDAQSLVFKTNNTEAMRMLTSGNIGINTTTPQYKLDINANTGSTGNPLRLLGLQAGSTSDSIISSNGGILRRLSIAQILGAGSWLTTGNSGTTAGTNFIGTTDAVDFVFKTNNAEEMRITSAGNVGVGTSAPNTVLDMNGGLAIRPSSTINLTADNQVVTVGNASFLALSSNNATSSNRTFTLSNGLQDGQLLMILLIGNNAELADSANCNVSSTFSMSVNDTISLIWYGSSWYETKRSIN
jgi:hypothetical protein